MRRDRRQRYRCAQEVCAAPADLCSGGIGLRSVTLLGLAGGGIRIALNVGEQRLELVAFDRKGRPYPENATAADLCFQHFALDTPDAGGTMGGRPRAWRNPDLPRRSNDAHDVRSLWPQIGTPHLELLRYRSPAGRPAEQLQANDVAATRIVWRSNRDASLRDPDGHLHQLAEFPA